MNKTVVLSNGEQIELNEAQYEAVTHEDGPLLIIAGAGTGKTKTLVSRVVYLINKRQVPEKNILMLTFTNQAAKEMLERICQYTGQNSTKITACTYHSFCNQILRKYAYMFGYTPDFSLCDPSDQADIIDLLRTKKELKLNDENFPHEKFISGLLSRSINKKEPIKCIISNLYPDCIPYMDDILSLCSAYMEYKKEHNILDYDDLLLFVNNLFRTCPSIAKEFSNQYTHICVDEYQDSNAVQADFLSLIRGFDNKNICVVGDDMQSIYAFRGADVQNILNFPKLFTDCKIIKLTENYRSTNEILALSNHVVSLAKEGFPKKLHGQKNGTKPEVYDFDSQEESITYILSDIKRKKELSASFNDFAVLVRGKMSARAFEVALRQNYRNLKIPYRKFGGMKFTEQPHIKDVMAFVHLLVNDTDEISWFRTLRLYPGIGKTYAKNIAVLAEQTGISALSDQSFKKKSFYSNLEILKEFIKSAKSRSFQKNLKHIIYDLYIPLRQLHIDEANVENESVRTQMKMRLETDKKDLRALYDASTFYKTEKAFLADFSGNQKEEADAITLTTVHSAKGLEWDTVYILDCVENTFNKVKTASSESEWAEEEVKENIEENTRLFYVAVTRARNRLVLLNPAQIMGANQTPAHFLHDADNLIDKNDGKPALLRKPEKMILKVGFEDAYDFKHFLSSDFEYSRVCDILPKKNKGRCQSCGLSLEKDPVAAVKWIPLNKRSKKQLVLSELYCICEKCAAIQNLRNVKAEEELDTIRQWYCHVSGVHPRDELAEEAAAYAECKKAKKKTSVSYHVKEEDMYDILGFMPEFKTSVSVIQCPDAKSFLSKERPEDPKPEKALITALKATEKQINYIHVLCRQRGLSLITNDLTKSQASDVIEFLLSDGCEKGKEAKRFLA